VPESSYPIFIPRPLAARIKFAGAQSPLAKQFVPSADEDQQTIQSCGLLDPIADQTHSPVPGLVHRYHNRALFFPTQVCPVQCRYCFRKNELGQGLEAFRTLWAPIETYLRAHPEIDEIIFSGGDPLMLDDERLQHYLDQLAQISSIKYVRFHTRVPTTLPSRISKDLIALLQMAQKKFSAVVVVAHINHADELNDLAVAEALALLRASGVQLLAQSVLLKGVNDSSELLEQLFRTLSERGLRPYYLHHPDPTRGAMHFCLSESAGKALFEPLRRRLPGWMLPHYVMETPQGGGKTLV
jgi:lysine 2,3-aminomutase